MRLTRACWFAKPRAQGEEFTHIFSPNQGCYRLLPSSSTHCNASKFLFLRLVAWASCVPALSSSQLIQASLPTFSSLRKELQGCNITQTFHFEVIQAFVYDTRSFGSPERRHRFFADPHFASFLLRPHFLLLSFTLPAKLGSTGASKKFKIHCIRPFGIENGMKTRYRSSKAVVNGAMATLAKSPTPLYVFFSQCFSNLWQ